MTSAEPCAGSCFIARPGTEHGSGLGKNRWVVEAAFVIPRCFRRLRIRWEIRADIHQTILTLGCAIIGWRRLKKQCPHVIAPSASARDWSWVRILCQVPFRCHRRSRS
ncbi:hypothetical protein ACN9M0_38585 [Streptomyces sp. R-07]|uniref:hypothetical protein n=1 Tax=Streptomyces sp. R-07 TaxID=3404052 RepID=UPI003CEFCBC4